MGRWSALVLVCLLAFTGCVYMNVEIPLDTNLDETTLGDKTGESEFHSILGLFAWGDAGTQAAAENGGITVLRHADRKMFSVLGFVYYRQTTVVYGD